MDGTTAVWLGLTLAAPLTLVPEIALLRLLHSKRSSWHPLDVLLVSLIVGQLCCTLVALGLSAAALARHAGLFLGHVDVPHHHARHQETLAGAAFGQAPLCAALVSFWAAAHTLHAATLTSMAVDRAMTVRWPYKYRLSVRRTQVRYHVVVLAVVSVLVGVATLFASSGSGHPLPVVYNAAVPTERTTPTPTPPLTVTPPGPTLPALLTDDETAATATTDFLPTPTNATDDAAAAADADENFAAGVDTITAEPLADARQMMFELSCAFLPYMFDSRFSLFWICLHGIFLIATVAAGAVVVVTRIVMACCSGDLVGLAAGSGSDMRTLGHASDGSSATLPMSGHHQHHQHHQHQAPGQPPRYTPGPCLGGSASVSPAVRSAKPMFGSADKSFVSAIHHDESGIGTGKTGKTDLLAVPSPGRCWNRQRHSTVAAVLVIAYLTHHLPLLVLTTLGTFFAHVLPPDWPYSAMALASSLGSSLIVMAALVVIDPAVHAWMMESLAPSSSRRIRRRPFPLDRHHHHHHHQRSPVTSESATLEQNLAPMKIDDEARYRISQIYSSEPAEAKFPLTNGSLFVHLMNPPSSSESGGARANRRPSRMGVSAYDQRHQQQRGSNATTLASSTHSSMYLDGSKPPLLTFMSRSKILSLNGMASDGGRPEPLYNDPGEFQHADEAMNSVLVSSMTATGTVGSTGSSTSTVAAGGKYRRNQEPIYASLSETVSSCNTLDSLGARILEEALVRDEAQQKKALGRPAPRRHHLDSEEDSDSDDVGSATESAGDDFEFHNIRTSRQTLISPGDEQQQQQVSRPRSRVARSATYRVLCNGLDVKCTKRGENDADVVISNSEDGTVPSKVVSKGVVAAASESQHGLVTCVTIQADESLESIPTTICSSSSLRRSKLLTSLSMNDIDIIGSADESSEERNEFSGPLGGRSDSLFSLCDENRSPEGQSRSELELSKLPLDGRRPRKPQRPSIQQHLQQLERHRMASSAANQSNCAASSVASAVQMRKKSSRRSRAAVLQRFQDRLHDSGFNTGTSRSSTCNGTPTGTTPSHVKTSHVVSIAALKAALSHSPMSYLDNGDVYPTCSPSSSAATAAAAAASAASQSKTVFVSEYI